MSPCLRRMKPAATHRNVQCPCKLRLIEVLEPRQLLSTVYVDINSPAGGTKDGTSWTFAYKNPEQALVAASAGDQIRVADGTYQPQTLDRTISFQLKNGVSIQGGYAGYGAANPDARDFSLFTTTLSGNINTAGSSDNSYHVVIATGINSATVLDGFTITAGSANGTGTQANGAGLYCTTSASPSVLNCTFTGNSASGKGGAIYAGISSSLALTNCTFIRNTAGTGGAIYNEFSSSPTLIACAINGNVASSDGGGVVNSSSSSPSFTNCTFSGNSANGYGGGIFNATSSSPTLINCTLSGNSAAYYGGGISSFSASNPTLINCVVWNNLASTSNQIYDSGSSSIISDSDIQDGWTGTGNVSTDPLVVRNPDPGLDSAWGTVDDDYGDLHLQACSPVADAGNNSAVPVGITTDFAGNSRFQNIPTTPDTGAGTAPIVDLGAYETTAALSASAGGPYVVLQGQNITLSGHGAGSVAGTLQYAWEFNGNGLFDDATGPSPTFSSALLSAGSITVSLRVTDSALSTVTSNATIIVLSSTVYVDSRATGANNGASWANAFSSLTTALRLAVPGVSIRTATGTYKPVSTLGRMTTFQLKNGVSVFGGYAGLGAPNPDARNIGLYQTMLSGDIGIAGNNTDNIYHVVTTNSTNNTAILDGFVVAGGNANGSIGPTVLGGGISNVGGSPTIANCIITGNFAATFGGGMYNTANSTPILTNCIFSANSVSNSGRGGGMYNSASSPVLANCTFSGNFTGSSGNGGAMYNTANSSPTLTSCTFSGNFTGSSGAGGGMYNTGSSSPSLANCTFTGNSVGSSGNGAGMYNSSSSPTLIACTFSANATGNSGNGGAIYDLSNSSPIISGCTFSGNIANNTGGAIYNSASSPSITNSVFIGNAAGGNGGAVFHDGGGSSLLNNCGFNGNAATNGGAVFLSSAASQIWTNCVFAGNTASSNGGGLYLSTVPGSSMTNCTFAGNLAANSGGAVYNEYNATLSNCILWGNSASSGSQIIGGSNSISYSDIQGGSGGAANITLDPLFVRNPNPGTDGKWATPDDDYGDLRLQVTSPCIDAGNNGSVPVAITTDLDGSPRLVNFPGVRDPGAIVDMGAYERPALLAASVVTFLTDAPKPTISVLFNGDVLTSTLCAGDLLLTNLTTGQVIDCASYATVSWNAATQTAAWKTIAALPDGNYRATLPAGSITSLNGDPLANATTFDFFALGGDANRDRKVDINDLYAMASNWQGNSKIFSQGDFNYDGKVDAADLEILAARWQATLALPAPAAPVSLNTVPRRSATRVISLIQ